MGQAGMSDPAAQIPINAGDGRRSVLLRAVRAGPLVVTLKRYRNDFEQSEHEHEHATIDLVVAGWGRGTYRRREMLSSPACVEYFAPGAAHSFRSGAVGIRTMHVVVPGSMAPRDGAAGRALDLGLDPSRCLGLSIALLREVTGAADALVVESLAMELAAEAWRWPATARGRAPWLRAIFERLHEERDRVHSLSALGAAHGVHPAHLAREFRRAVGVPVGEYSRRLRLAEAARRIAAGREPLSRVASSCGFVDQAHLARRFRRHTGVTARGLRRSLGERGGDS